MLIPEHGSDTTVDLVSGFRSEHNRWGDGTLCSVKEIEVPSEFPHRVFGLPAHVVQHPTKCTMVTEPGATILGQPLYRPAQGSCSVDIGFVPAWTTPKLPDLGSSFVAVLNENSCRAASSAEVFDDQRSMDVVTNWSPVTLMGTQGCQTGSLRYRYTLTARDPSATNVASRLSPETLAGLLDAARLETTGVLAQSGISLETFMRVPGAQVDYSAPNIPVLNLPIYDIEGIPDYNGNVDMASYDVNLTVQCRFDTAAQ